MSEESNSKTQASQNALVSQNQTPRPGSSQVTEPCGESRTADSSTPLNKVSEGTKKSSRRSRRPRSSRPTGGSKNHLGSGAETVSSSNNPSTSTSQASSEHVNASSTSNPSSTQPRRTNRRNGRKGGKFFSQLSSHMQDNPTDNPLGNDTPPVLPPSGPNTATKSDNPSGTHKRRGPRHTKSVPPLAPDADLRTTLAHKLTYEVYECMVCCETVKANQGIWSCQQCWAPFHLRCVQKWARKSIKQQRNAETATSSSQASVPDHYPPAGDLADLVSSLFVVTPHTNNTSTQTRRRQNQPNGSTTSLEEHADTDLSHLPTMFTWRCPGCQNESMAIPRHYKCFCGKRKNPATVPTGNDVPHSCGQPCGRPRKPLTGNNAPACPHPCPLPCHPGPCPPCTALAPLTFCYCGKKQYQVRCSEHDPAGTSCDQPCGELLECGEHTCQEICHAELCPPCLVIETQQCYCGQSVREGTCGSGSPRSSYHTSPGEDSQEPAIGYYACDQPCPEYYDCGVHQCLRPCHPRGLEPDPCPFAPTQIATCPCGKTPLSHLLPAPRTSCTDPIPVCDQPCRQVLPCGHRCQQSCHHGKCPPCPKTSTLPCRCGQTRVSLPCSERIPLSNTPWDSLRFTDPTANYKEQWELALCRNQKAENSPSPPLCRRRCKALKDCGRHVCQTQCCPVNAQSDVAAGTTALEDSHECKLVCDRKRNCGIHICNTPCHRGPCPPCMEATFSELSCPCGRTRLMPPIPCNTKLPPCPYPCTRTSACGHSQSSMTHPCHADDKPCPPCAVLITRRCHCGSNTIPGVPCYRGIPSCGRICGRPLPCGGHTCQRPCHGGLCVDAGVGCQQQCGKPRAGCGHPCQKPCHAPALCPSKTHPCVVPVQVTCPCGLRVATRTCDEVSQSQHSESPLALLECDNQCAVTKRKQMLAQAFQIGENTGVSSKWTPGTSSAISGDPTQRHSLAGGNTDGSTGMVGTLHPYHKYHPLFREVPSVVVIPHFPEELIDFAYQNPAWVKQQETQIERFLLDPQRQVLRFPPMKPTYRKVLHQWATVFQLKSVSLDAEPNRSVSWMKQHTSLCFMDFPLSRTVQLPRRVWKDIQRDLTQGQTATGPANTSVKPVTIPSVPMENPWLKGKPAKKAPVVTDSLDASHAKIDSARHRAPTHANRQLTNAFILTDVIKRIRSPQQILDALVRELGNFDAKVKWLDTLGSRHLLIIPHVPQSSLEELNDLTENLCPLIHTCLVDTLKYGSSVERCRTDASGQIVKDVLSGNHGPGQGSNTTMRPTSIDITLSGPNMASNAFLLSDAHSSGNNSRTLEPAASTLKKSRTSLSSEGGDTEGKELTAGSLDSDSKFFMVEHSQDPLGSSRSLKVPKAPRRLSESSSTLATSQEPEHVLDNWEDLADEL
ncbi:FKBP12-associated protein [Dispira parvispora]|uniref:FKBP12-associated protein n=1 Tax=Dispira parvispora TaxID=1520584 RepID=A0A9W8E214_9FUNG|nr:FKBP12-associated protein [Dispira parvispora]